MLPYFCCNQYIRKTMLIVIAKSTNNLTKPLPSWIEPIQEYIKT